MGPERWRRVKEVFHGAVERPPEAVEAYLAAACGDDPAIAREVERLLTCDRLAGGFTERPAFELLAGLAGARPAEPPLPADSDLDPGHRLGSYSIERELGRGGMGVVYLAIREGDGFRRRVAIKLIRRGLDCEEVLDRFRRERRILAAFHHPFIAQLYDAASTDGGRPYFVMEYVEGLPIDRWCDRRELGVAERLRLFMRVCAAVDHAHRALVVHRDLKPGNVLITAEGVPKLLDFGLARWLDEEGGCEERTLPWQRRLTPEYASPERLGGEPPTTSCDVYSLGVVLYRLLTGRLPRPPAGRGMGTVREPAPDRGSPRPSAAVAAGGEAPPGTGGSARLARRLRGDLDRVTLRALADDPAHRYGTAAELARDIERHLTGLPVAAAPPSRWYRARKFVRRHRLGSALAAALAVASMATAGLAVRLDRALEGQRLALDHEARQRARAEAVTGFLLDSIAAADPMRAADSELTLRAMADRWTERLGEFDRRPDLQAALMDALGRVYQNLGRFQEAEPLLAGALERRRALHGGRHADVAASLDRLGRLRRTVGDLAGAEPLIERGLALRRELLGEDDPAVAESLRNLGLLRSAQGDQAAAADHLEQSLALRWRALGDDHPDVAEAHSNLGAVLFRAGRLDAAGERFSAAAAIYRRHLGSEHVNVGAALGNLGLVLRERGQLDAATKRIGESLAIFRAALGDGHPAVAAAFKNRGLVHADRGDYASAEADLRAALERNRAAFGDRHPRVAADLHALAIVVHASGGRSHEAEAMLRRAVDLDRQALVEGHLQTSRALGALGAVVADLGRPVEAEPLLRRAVAGLRAGLPQNDWRIGAAEGALGVCLADLGRADEAAPLLAAGRAALEDLAVGHPQRRLAEARWVRLSAAGVLPAPLEAAPGAGSTGRP